MGLEILFLLLPVATLSGWWVGRKGQQIKANARSRNLSQGYLQGLSYLISEQPDKAIEVFIRMLEVDSDTLETHFALGSLFRRRGEVDRAIRIHQNLIARPALTVSQRNHALYELGWDYFAAGLLDRAENLFQELATDPEFRPRALAQLQDIYQQEKEWEKAIEVAERRGSHQGNVSSPAISHYYCELAEKAFQVSDPEKALRLIRSALAADPLCVRASLLEAKLELHRNAPHAALLALARIEQQDPESISESVPLLHRAYTQAGKSAELMSYLEHLLKSCRSVAVLLAYTECLRNREGMPEAIAALAERLRFQPSLGGLLQLVDMKLAEQTAVTTDNLVLFRELLSQQIDSKPRYRCKSCGFVGKVLHWQCPSCKQWNTVKPIHGIDGEWSTPTAINSAALNETAGSFEVPRQPKQLPSREPI